MIVATNKGYLFNFAWISQKEQLAAKNSTSFRFGLSWFFPNHYDVKGNFAGKYYATRFNDSRTVVIG